MDQEQAVNKAREFADRAHGVEVGKISRQAQDKLTESRSRLAAMGTLMSGSAVRETAIIHGERITAMLQSRLDLLLEGFGLHQVVVNDHLVDRVVRELTSLRDTWIKSTGHTFNSDVVLSSGLVPQASFMRLLEQNIGLDPNEIRTQIDRRRLMPKKVEGSTSINVYHVQGNNNRWLTNSQDHSVNVITQSSNQIFADLRQQIESQVPAGMSRRTFLKNSPR